MAAAVQAELPGARYALICEQCRTPAPSRAALTRTTSARRPLWRRGLFFLPPPGSSHDRSDDEPDEPLRRAGHPGALAAGVGRAGARSGPASAAPSSAPSTCWTCSRTPRATCTWATPRPTRWATSSRATGCSAATTSCTRSAGTPSGCRRRTPRSSAASTRASGPTRTSPRRRRRCAATPCSLRLGPRAPHLRPGVLPLEPVAVPAVARAGPGLPQGLAGQLVPEGPDRAGQRAGRRRAVRALRHRRSPRRS